MYWSLEDLSFSILCCYDPYFADKVVTAGDHFGNQELRVTDFLGNLDLTLKRRRLSSEISWVVSIFDVFEEGYSTPFASGARIGYTNTGLFSISCVNAGQATRTCLVEVARLGFQA